MAAIIILLLFLAVFGGIKALKESDDYLIERDHKTAKTQQKQP